MAGSQRGQGEQSSLLGTGQVDFVARSAPDESRELARDYSTFNGGINQVTPQHVPSLATSVRHTFSNAWNAINWPVQNDAPDRAASPAEEHKYPRSTNALGLDSLSKLGTFDGVFVPTSLNVLSVLMFLRFGFILGQTGVLGMASLLVVCYLINLLTTLSVSAIATNGTVRGGGAYYMISRSLGPEFGGSIGIVFFLGNVLNAAMNAVGLVDCFVQAFGHHSGNWSHWLPDSYWYQYLWATLVLALCTLICLGGSATFARCSNVLLLILLVATLSIPISTLFVQPFENKKLHIEYKGLSMANLIRNLEPRLSRGAAGSVLHGKEDFRDLFGILFPATGGIFAGASMSGDLKNPSRSIPSGTLSGLLLTFTLYALVILSLGATITRETFYHNVNIVQDVNLSQTLILLGEFSTSFFSTLMGVIGGAKLLQALARDDLMPGLKIFAKGTPGKDEPLYGIILTYLVTQIAMLSNINQLASFVTMAFLMTFLVTNLACFLLKISSAPNFRPSFKYFNWKTALTGTCLSGFTMFFVDGVYASACIGLLVALFAIIHYTSLPKTWGDVSQALIYHSVRKYLLRLRQEHVKFWRPQILLFVNDPRRSYKLIQFCNSLKKGGLFVLGHVIISTDFAGAVPEARKQQQTWTKYIDFSKIKAFVNVAISPGLEWGSRNVVLGAGLGGMRPNIVIMGFYNLTEYRQSKPADKLMSPSKPKFSKPGVNTLRKRSVHDKQMSGQMPTDENRAEKAVGPRDYVTVIEDMILRLKVNMALAIGFDSLELPAKQDSLTDKLSAYFHTGHYHPEENSKQYIDLWPIQMSADIAAEGAGEERNVHTTNFDTYTLILQLGCILSTVPSWKRAYTLRVAVFVEYESDVEEERGRVEALLTNLRIEAEVMVFWLAAGDLESYEIIVNGETDVDPAMSDAVEDSLEDDEWWQELKKSRDDLVSDGQAPRSTFHQSDAISSTSGVSTNMQRFERLGRLLRRRSRRSSLANLSRFGINPTMQTHRLDPDLLERTSTALCPSDDSDSGSDIDGDTTAEQSDEEYSDHGSAASENDRERYAFSPQSPPTIPRRSTVPAISPPTSRPASEVDSKTHSRPTSIRTSKTLDEAGDERMADSTPALSNSDAALESTGTPESPKQDGKESRARPSTTRHKSYPRLTSSLMPRATVATEETTGPSIMFRTPSPPGRTPSNPLHSIYRRATGQGTSLRRQRSTSQGSQSNHDGPIFSSRAPSTAAASAQDLSFNNLPCRAQHLILNELMQKYSGNGDQGETAVVFTTLPPPSTNTCENEDESLRYLIDLETLCQGMPPMLMIHSNSMSVTMNL